MSNTVVGKNTDGVRETVNAVSKVSATPQEFDVKAMILAILSEVEDPFRPTGEWEYSLAHKTYQCSPKRNWHAKKSILACKKR